MALGAGTARLSRQLFTETLLLAAGGAVLALPLASGLGNLLPMLVPHVHAPVAIGFQLNGRVLMVMRANAGTALKEGRKWYCVSRDGGRTWDEPRVWTYADGTPYCPGRPVQSQLV